MPALLQVTRLHKSYGPDTILDEVTTSFSTEQKIGCIGRNGAGKSTLCKIMTGHEEADSGSVTRSSDLRLSYLEQHDVFRLDETPLQFLERYTKAEEWRCGEMAGKFRLKNDVLNAPMSALPGGFRTRVKLAAMLLQNPNFLILDEPSNYLDLATLILLENFLREFNGGFIIVSHDREFLKRTSDHTLEVENGRLTLYPGSIEEYFEFKEGQLQHKLAYNKTIARRKEELQVFIDRFRAKASTAARAKSKMKQLERLKTIEIEHSLSTVKIYLPYVEPKSGLALVCDNLNIGYSEKTVAEKINLDIDRGARVAVLGDNGQGKTTFLRTIAGDLVPLEGTFRWGTNLKLAYYAQHVSQALHPQDDVFTHLQREAVPDVKTQDVLNMAGCFLFKGDDVKKKVSVLSGGEKARLCLAGLLLSKNQVLLLDEPTNHLDFETVEALANALKTYTGTLFFISHDRTFVNLVANAIIEVKNGKVMKYPGKYEDYVYHLEVQARELYEEDAADTEPESDVQDGEESPNPLKKEKSKEARRAEKAEITKLRSQINKTEGRIKHLTKEKEDLLKELEDNPFHFSRQRNERIKQLTVLIEQEESSWLALQSQLEQLIKEGRT